VAERKRSFWDRLFGTNNQSGRQQRLLEYIVHRVKDGANLQEVLQEEYVRRNATSEEVGKVLENPSSLRPLVSSCVKTSPPGNSIRVREDLRSRYNW
jgi:hypothetical protein